MDGTAVVVGCLGPNAENTPNMLLSQSLVPFLFKTLNSVVKKKKKKNYSRHAATYLNPDKGH